MVAHMIAQSKLDMHAQVVQSVLRILALKYAVMPTTMELIHANTQLLIQDVLALVLLFQLNGPVLTNSLALITVVMVTMYKLQQHIVMMVVLLQEMDAVLHAQQKQVGHVLEVPPQEEILAHLFMVMDISEELKFVMMEIQTMETVAAQLVLLNQHGFAQMLNLVCAQINVEMDMFMDQAMVPHGVMMETPQLEMVAQPHAQLNPTGHAQLDPPQDQASVLKLVEMDIEAPQQIMIMPITLLTNVMTEILTTMTVAHQDVSQKTQANGLTLEITQIPSLTSVEMDT